MPTKKTIITITIQQCQQIIAMASREPLWSQTALANWATAQFKFKTPMDRTTVCKILKRADKIKSVTHYRLARSRSTPAQFPSLESALVKWIDRANNMEVSVTGFMIREEAERIAEELHIALQDRNFSTGWLCRFYKRHRIRSMLDYGEAGSCDKEQVVKGRIESQDATQAYHKRDVYNLDETALNYCAHTRRSQRRPGTKQGRKLNKQQITIMLATNGGGTEKLPPYYIETTKKQRCFKRAPASQYGLSYDANAKGWMHSDLFGVWLQELDSKFRNQQRHVLLLMDNVSSHKTEGLKLPISGSTKLPQTRRHSTSRWMRE